LLLQPLLFLRPSGTTMLMIEFRTLLYSDLLEAPCYGSAGDVPLKPVVAVLLHTLLVRDAGWFWLRIFRDMAAASSYVDGAARSVAVGPPMQYSFLLDEGFVHSVTMSSSSVLVQLIPATNGWIRACLPSSNVQSSGFVSWEPSIQQPSLFFICERCSVSTYMPDGAPDSESKRTCANLFLVFSFSLSSSVCILSLTQPCVRCVSVVRFFTSMQQKISLCMRNGQITWLRFSRLTNPFLSLMCLQMDFCMRSERHLYCPLTLIAGI
jgi:hypothetical protein